ncbi:MAG: hypothetical protein HS113_24815 [Verrucomicrobiales bacterium]|nr:hypothetical protein [Verrucomicrobiales bacterium]
MLEQFGEVFPGVVAAGEIEGDAAILDLAEDTGGEDARALASRLGALPLEALDAHLGVIIVDELRLGGQPGEFLVSRLRVAGGLFHQLPLRGGRQGIPKSLCSFSSR